MSVKACPDEARPTQTSGVGSAACGPPVGAENDGGSLAGNESSEASSTRLESSLSCCEKRRRCPGRYIAARPAPAATAMTAQTVRDDILMRLAPFGDRRHGRDIRAHV